MNTKRKQRFREARKHEGCFYCGGSFNSDDYPHFPKVGEPCSKKARRWITPTVEHLEAKANGGAKGSINCTIAHLWCNTQAGNLPVDEKLALKGEKILELIKERDAVLLERYRKHSKEKRQ